MTKSAGYVITTIGVCRDPGHVVVIHPLELAGTADRIQMSTASILVRRSRPTLIPLNPQGEGSSVKSFDSAATAALSISFLELAER